MRIHSYSDWLPEHVALHGAVQWDKLGDQFQCPAALCALKWHVIQLDRLGAQAMASKFYSEWELCLLFVACNPPSGRGQMSKKATLAELSKWVPGRSGDALRQAYAHHIAGNEAKYLVKLSTSSWPSEPTALLALWPGPSAHAQAILNAQGVEGHKAAAAQVLLELSALRSLGNPHTAAPSTAASAPAATDVGNPQRVRSALLLAPTPCLEGNSLCHAWTACPQQQLLLGAPAPLSQQQQIVQLPGVCDAFVGAPGGMAAVQQYTQCVVSGAGNSTTQFAQPPWGCDLPAQIAADLASPCSNRWALTPPPTAAAEEGSGGTAVSGMHTVDGDVELLQLLGGQHDEQGMPAAAAGQAHASPHSPSCTAQGSPGKSHAGVEQQHAGMAIDAVPNPLLSVVGSAAATSAAGFLHNSALTSEGAYVPSHQLQELLFQMQQLGQQQNLICTLLTGITHELRGVLSRFEG